MVLILYRVHAVAVYTVYCYMVTCCQLGMIPLYALGRRTMVAESNAYSSLV